ncbi:MAG: right-handed parallel beta-helix repeat-containing protein, partial [Anaerolineae bacterium]|nr:right-handed parallel beta-helix repeat-containing protein [Anaerolineae bacterium]
MIVIAGLTACTATELPHPTATLIATSTPAPTAVIPLTADVFFVAPEGDDANPGTFAQPWATANHAAEVLEAGQTVYLRGGVYALPRQVRPAHSGREDAWITCRAYPGEQPVLDASAIDNDPSGQFSHDAGSFNIERRAYIRVIGLTVQNSHQVGFMVRDAQHIELLNNIADTTFSPGIGVWRTDGTDGVTEHIKIIGNTVTRASTWEMLPKGYVRQGEPPHEAISIAGAHHFEVAYNHVYDCDKEGIDVKETSAHGRVHHNYI